MPGFAVRSLVALSALTLLAGCASVTPPVAPTFASASADPRGVTVYIVYNHFHSGLTVPTAALRAHPGPTTAALTRLRSQPWTTLGYGDAKFYQQAGINPPRVLDFFRSMFGLNNPSVVNLAGVADPLKDASHPRILRLTIAADRFGDLERAVDRSFAARDGDPVFVAPGQTGDDAFFKGRRPASAIHECNQWIGEVLGAAGVPHTPALDTTADGLALDLTTSGRAIHVF